MNAKFVKEFVLKAMKERKGVEVKSSRRFVYGAKFIPVDVDTFEFVAFHEFGCVRVKVDDIETTEEGLVLLKNHKYVTFVSCWNVDELTKVSL